MSGLGQSCRFQPSETFRLCRLERTSLVPMEHPAETEVAKSSEAAASDWKHLNRRVWNTSTTSRDPRHGTSSYEVVDARRKCMLIAGAVIAC